jgi:hypothetical protein
MVASQIAQKSSTGINAKSAPRSRRGIATRSWLHGRLLATKSARTVLPVGDENGVDTAGDKGRLTPLSSRHLTATEVFTTIAYLHCRIW